MAGAGRVGLDGRIVIPEDSTMHPASGTRRFRRVALATTFAVLGQGCSALFIRPPPSESTGEPPQCTESPAAPIADSLFATGALVLAAASLAAHLSCCAAPGEKPGASLPLFSAALALGVGASAVDGFRATGRCREAVTSWCASHDCGEPDAPR